MILKFPKTWNTVIKYSEKEKARQFYQASGPVRCDFQ